MEQKRTIWITLAAGFFLLVVIGAAVILYKGSAVKTNPAVIVDSSDIWVTQTPLPSNITVEEDSSVSGYATEIPEEETDIEEEDKDADNGIAAEVEPAKTESASGTSVTDNLTVVAMGNTSIYSTGTTTIDLTASTPSSVTPQNKKAETAMAQVQSEKAKTQPKTQPAADTKASSTKESKPVTTQKTTTAKTSATTAAKPAASSTTVTPKTNTAQKTPDRYWVQAASYTNKINADEARSVLEAQKIQCEVFTHTDEKGTIYYRVRVGPYTTKSEAEYWKQKIDAISLFAKNGTYVTNSSASK